MTYAPQSPLLIATVQPQHLRYTITRYTILVIVTLLAGIFVLPGIAAAIALLDGSMKQSEAPIVLILGIPGLLIVLMLLSNWTLALRPRPAQLRFYEDGVTLHNRAGKVFAGYPYTQVKAIDVTQRTSTLYTVLFGLIGGVVGGVLGGIPGSLIKSAAENSGEWIDADMEKQIVRGTPQDIQRTQITMLFEKNPTLYTVNSTFEYFPLILERIPPHIRSARAPKPN